MELRVKKIKINKTGHRHLYSDSKFYSSNHGISYQKMNGLSRINFHFFFFQLVDVMWLLIIGILHTDLFPHSFCQSVTLTPMRCSFISPSHKQRWEFIKENKKSRTWPSKWSRKTVSFFLFFCRFLGRVLVFFLVFLIAFLVEFLFSYFLVFFYKFPPLQVNK